MLTLVFSLHFNLSTLNLEMPAGTAPFKNRKILHAQKKITSDNNKINKR